MIAADWTPTGRKLRQFAAALALVALVFLLRRGANAWTIALAAISVAGFAWPAVIRPVYLVVTLVTLPIGWVVSHILLRIIYYLVLTPVALLFRLAGRDPLALRGRSADSNWVPFAQGEDVESYFRQT